MYIVGKETGEHKVEVGNEVITLIYRIPTPTEIKKFLKSRFVMKKRGKVDDNSVEAGVRFVDSILTDCFNVGFEKDGKVVELKAKDHPDWKDHIPPTWKLSLAGKFSETPEYDPGEHEDYEAPVEKK